MLKTIEAESFFSDKTPSFIPNDTVTPDWNYLLAHVNKLDASVYTLESLKTILSHENKRIGADIRSLESIDNIDSNTVFVVTGQQAGLFGGPVIHTLQSFAFNTSGSQNFRSIGEKSTAAVLDCLRRP